MSNGTLPTQSNPPPLVQDAYSTPPDQPVPPGTYPPSPHGPTHISSDLVPVVTTSSVGLAPQLSGNPNTWLNGIGGFTTPPGTPLNMKGTVPTASALPMTGNNLNDLYTTVDTGHAWAWNGTTWVDMGAFQGPPGPAGSSGTSGSSATVDCGPTVTGAPGTNANVNNAGSPSAAVFNFTIPRGSQWFNGNGPPLSTGIPGALPGDYYLDNISADVYVVT